jgi:hypothetical protein
MGLLNKILSATNTALKVTNLYGGSPATQATDSMAGLPLGTSDGTPTGEVVLKVKTVGAAPTPPPAASTQFTATASVTVTGVSTSILASNANRTSVVLQNTHATANLYLNGTAAAVVGQGVKLAPLQLAAIEVSGAIEGISDGANINVAIWETLI